MKFLHIVQPSVRMMNTYIKMVTENFSKEDHAFYFIQKCPASERELFNYSNVFQMNGETRTEKIKDFYKMLNQAENIIWHGYMHPTRFAFFLLIFRKFLKKSTWLMWGIDLYNWERPVRRIKDRIANFFEKMCREQMGAVIALVEPDVEAFKKTFPKSKAKCYIAPYPISMESFNTMEKLSKWKKRSNGETYVQVAHNAHGFNNHLDILESMAHFSEENIKLFIPMSYGNDWNSRTDNYVHRVERAAQEIFGDKNVTILRRLMPQNEYTKFLWNMDICVFKADRQNALGNMLKSLYVGNKVFLSPRSPLYQFFLDNGIKVYNSDDIREMSFEEFATMPDRTTAVEWIRRQYHLRYAVETWGNVFSDMCGYPVDRPDSTALEEKYPILEAERDRATKNVRKDNWLGLERYITTNTEKRKEMRIIKDLVIVGTDRCARRVLQCVYSAAINKRFWFVKGFLGDKEILLQSLTGSVDVIGSVSEWVPDEVNEQFICAIENGRERQAAVEELKKKGAVFTTIQGNNVKIGYGTTMGEGLALFPDLTISVNCKIGSHNSIGQAIIEEDVYIGDFCTIGDGCVIGHGTVIEDRVTLHAGCVIPPFTVIKQDRVVLPGKITG